MKKIISISLFFYCIAGNASVVKDSLLINDLIYSEYSSDDEKKYFISYFIDKDSSALFKILLSAGTRCSKEQIAKSIDDYKIFLEDIKRASPIVKSEFEATKKIYHAIHKKFLMKYEITNTFCELFINGNYNCVTASALYGFYFNSLNIPYTVKELENHVYIVAYPDTKKILIETTNPAKGYLQYNQAFVKAFVEELYKNKVISDVEYHASNINVTFNKYFFKAEDINLTQLCGLQYYNLGLEAINKQEYKTAFLQFRKASFLYPSTKIRFLMKQALASAIDVCKYQTQEEAYYLVLLSKFNTSLDKPFDTDVFKSEFIRLTNNQFIATGDTILYAKSYRILKEGIKDTLITKEIEFIYNYEIARIALNTKKKKSIEQNLDAIYYLKPNNTEVQSIILYYLSNVLSRSSAKETFEMMTKYRDKYPFLEGTEMYNEILLNCFLDFAVQQFAKNNQIKGEEYLSLFEKRITANNQSIYNIAFAEKAYAEATAFYFRKGNNSKAKILVKRGLVYVPESNLLLNMMNSLR